MRLYHGSQAAFEQLSNAYHYSGNGKMRAGWGIYLGSDKEMVFRFPLDMPAIAMIWVVDGKKIYHQDINSGYYFLEETKDYWRFHVTYEKYHHHNWRDDLIYFLRQLYRPDKQESPKAAERHALVLKKLEAAKEVKLLPCHRFYLYTIEITARKIFYNEDHINPQLRRAINKRLAAEKRRMVYPVQSIKRTHYNGIYGQLEAAFRHRYRYAKPEKDSSKLTSLFLHRMGYDLIKTNYLKDEYLLIDVTKAKVVEREEYGPRGLPPSQGSYKPSGF